MKLFSVFALSLMIVLSASAAEKKKKSTPTETKVATEAPQATSSYSGEADINLTASIGAVDGNFVYGPGLQMEWPVILEGNQFAVGFQTGYYRSSVTETVFGVEAKSTTWGVPIMASGKYIFQSGIDFLKPYFAIAFGLGIDHTSGDVNAGAGLVVSKKETNLHFTFLARPGVEFGATQHWFAELPFGVLFTDFAIMPTLGYRF